MRTRALLPAALILAALGVAAPFGPALADCVTSNLMNDVEIFSWVNYDYNVGAYYYNGQCGFRFDCVGPDQSGSCFLCMKATYYDQTTSQVISVDNLTQSSTQCQATVWGTLNMVARNLAFGHTYKITASFDYPFWLPDPQGGGSYQCSPGDYSNSVVDVAAIPNDPPN